MLTPADADKLIGERLACLPIESLPLAQCAGAVLRENIYAERDAPPFDRVAMDGIALQSETARGGTRRFRIQATQAAGDPALTLDAKSACIEVMTGAVMPAECDAVVPVEQISTSARRGRARRGRRGRGVAERPSPRHRLAPGGVAAINRNTAVGARGRRRGFGGDGARAGQQPADGRRDLDR